MTKKLRILSLNSYGAPQSLNWKARYVKLIKEIKKLRPNVILLQEVVFNHQKRFLMSHLSDYKHFSPDFDYRYNMCGGLFTISNLEVKDYSFNKYFNQGPTFSPLAVTDRLLRKGFESYKINFDGSEVNVINTHLFANYRNGLSELRTIFSQVKQLYLYLDQMPKDKPLLVGGDFNIDNKSEIYDTFVDSADLYDPMQLTDSITLSRQNTNRNFFLLNFNKKIDHLFIRNINPGKVSQRVIFKKPYTEGRKRFHVSDHFGLMTEVYV